MKTFIVLTLPYERYGAPKPVLKLMRAESLLELYVSIKNIDEEDRKEDGLDNMSNEQLVQHILNEMDDDYLEIHELEEFARPYPSELRKII